MSAVAGAAAYWCVKALSKGRREKLGTVSMEHNLPALLQNQGLLNQTA